MADICIIVCWKTYEFVFEILGNICNGFWLWISTKITAAAIYVAMGMGAGMMNFWMLNVVMITGFMTFCVPMFGFIRKDEKCDDGGSHFKR